MNDIGVKVWGQVANKEKIEMWKLEYKLFILDPNIPLEFSSIFVIFIRISHGFVSAFCI